MSKHTQLLLLATFIAGASWILIPSQIVSVPYSLSIGYRFILAGSVLLLYCFRTKLLRKLPIKLHCLLFFQGICMYCIPHSLNYNASSYIPTGVISLLLGFTIVPNTILGSIFSSDHITKSFLKGATISILGIVLILYNDLNKLTQDILTVIGFSLVLGSTFSTSVGTILSKKILQGPSYSLFFINGIAMLYGGAVSVVFYLLKGGSLVFDFSYGFVLPFLYLSVIVTPLVFGIYLKLAKEVNAAFAGYIWLFMPVVALNISIVFEDFKWTIYSILGTIFVIFGSYVSSQKASKNKGKT